MADAIYRPGTHNKFSDPWNCANDQEAAKGTVAPMTATTYGDLTHGLLPEAGPAFRGEPGADGMANSALGEFAGLRSTERLSSIRAHDANVAIPKDGGPDSQRNGGPAGG